MTPKRVLSLNKFSVRDSSDGLKSSLTLSQPNSADVVLPIVQADERHRNYIISTWTRSLRGYPALSCTNGFVSLWSKSADFMAGEARLAERFWQHSKALVSPDDDFTVYGWVCYLHGCNTVLHCYVAPEFRANGVGRALLEHVAGNEYASQKPPKFIPSGHTVRWNPYGVIDVQEEPSL